MWRLGSWKQVRSAGDIGVYVGDISIYVWVEVYKGHIPAIYRGYVGPYVKIIQGLQKDSAGKRHGHSAGRLDLCCIAACALNSLIPNLRGVSRE